MVAAGLLKNLKVA